MPEIKLKPCPFCGGRAEMSPTYPSIHALVCIRCDAKTADYLSIPAAVKAWNTRYSEKETPPSANE